jgi:hypothetical protein
MDEVFHNHLASVGVSSAFLEADKGGIDHLAAAYHNHHEHHIRPVKGVGRMQGEKDNQHRSNIRDATHSETVSREGL